MLAEQDGKAAGGQGQPPGRIGRQGEGQQYRCDQGAAVAEKEADRALPKMQDYCLERESRAACPEQIDQGSEAI